VIGSAPATLMMSRAALARPATGPIHECSLSRWLKTRSVKYYLREESIHNLLGIIIGR